MHRHQPTSRALAGAIDSARRALAGRHANDRRPADPDADREQMVLNAVREGDDGAFVFQMLRAVLGRAPSLEEFGDRLARLRIGETNRYQLADREIARLRSPAPDQPDAGGCDTGQFLTRTLFHLTEFEALAPHDFLVAAFCASLKRMPDRFSYAHYQSLMEAGTDRAAILAQLLQSDEARMKGARTAVIGVAGAEEPGAVAAELAELHRRNRHLEYLTGFLQAQQQSLAARLQRLEQRG
jgi:hypothetical protein